MVIHNKLSFIIDKIHTLREYLKISGGDRISRRYFIMNSFDGLVTILGVIVGALVAGVIDPAIIIGIGMGSTIGMVISGFSGTFIAEKTEREIDLEKLKQALLAKSMDNTIHQKIFRTTVLWVSIIDAISPAISAIIALTPQLLAVYGFIDSYTATIYSILLILSFLFILGVYLARITRKNVIRGGLTLLAIGIGTTLVIILLLSLLGY